MKNKEIVREIHNMKQIKIDDIPIDVTGGINRKIKEAFKISRMGIDVLMVNGLKPDRIITGLNNKKVKGTIIRGVNK